MSGIELVVELARWLIGVGLLTRLARLEDEDATGSMRTTAGVSVIIPARNEEENLTALLERLAAPATPGVEVLVVDDGSTDGTVQVAARRGVRVIRAGAPPPGWTGKSWACHRGAQEARGGVFVFVDADVVVSSATIASVAACQDRYGGIVSVQPFHAVGRPYEQLSMFPNLIAAMGVGAFTIAGRRLQPRGAFGPCLAIDRGGYRSIGGHEAVKGAVAEDVALAQRARGVVPVTLLSSRGAVAYRMYPQGVGALFEGWVKNLASGATSVHPVIGLLVAAWVSGLLAAPFAGPVIYGLYALQVFAMARRLGRFTVVAAAMYPVPLAFFLVVFLTSIVRTAVIGDVRWRGRSISTRGTA